MKSAEAELLAELYVDLKGRRDKRLDWITIATKCKELSNLYGGFREAASKLGVSLQLVRSIVSLLDLPAGVQTMVKDRSILFDAAQRLNTLKDPRRMVRVARQIRNLPSRQQREIIQFAKGHPDADLVDFRKRVAHKETRTERIHLLMIPVDDLTFNALQALSRKGESTVQGTILKAVHQLVSQGTKP
ncbi:MAG: hypothetical protein L3J95_01735 [Thermoplasmata archaeon]|nr:hypothetical protein [Thermoplasmata archaeon]MCI4359134.1 hypothetical protein [Thermoplasmata archaeon]